MSDQQHTISTPTTVRKPAGAFNATEIRKAFPILTRTFRGKPLVFLDSGASSQKPQVVIDAISDYYQCHHANVHRGVYALSAEATDLFEAARNRAVGFLNAGSSREVIFTKGTTEGINCIATCFERAILKPGDEVLISAMEHHSNIVPWQMACIQTGAVLKVIPVDDRGEIQYETLPSLITDRTRIISIVHVSNTLGTINDVAQVIRIAHERNIPVMLDGAQAAPHMQIDAQGLDVDFYVCSSHKMYGPTGIGLLYGKEAWLDRLPPYQGGGEMIREVTFEKTEYNTLPFKFEAGTPNIADSIGLGAAIQFLQRLPREEIQQHEQLLLETATAELKMIDGLRVIGEAKNKASVLSFVIEGLHPHDIGTLLDQQGIAVRTGHHCTEPLMNRFGIPGTVRASFGMYNTLDDVAALTDGVTRAVKMLRG
jgi:cysteine desulfurase/selenocysteine lyase